MDRRKARARISTPSSSAAAPPTAATSPSKTATPRASIWRWSSSPTTPAISSTTSSTAPIPALNATGKDVVVIGGGDTGTDCVGTSLRHGCKSVIQLEIMPSRPISAPPTTRGPSGRRFTRWTTARKKPPPSKARTRATIWCRPSVSSRTTHGNLTGLEIVDIEWAKDDQGRFIPEGNRRQRPRHPRQLALLAMGFTGPETGNRRNSSPSKPTPAPTSKPSTANSPPTSPESSPPATSAVASRLVVWAINEGRGAARECDRFLMGVTNLP